MIFAAFSCFFSLTETTSKNIRRRKKEIEAELAVSQREGKTVCVPCVAWKELAETINKYCRKGKMCVIIGKLKNRLVSIKDRTERTQRYTKLKILVHKIFFVDREGKEEINELLRDWSTEEEDLPF